MLASRPHADGDDAGDRTGQNLGDALFVPVGRAAEVHDTVGDLDGPVNALAAARSSTSPRIKSPCGKADVRHPCG